MKLNGISDSLAGQAQETPVCPNCGGAARVRGGSCVSCLLLTALEEGEPAGKESFDAVLAEIQVPDSEWRIGNYQILEEIGRGGMGVIYRARQRHSKRIVALKRVLTYHGDSRDTLERFRREAEAAASLDHPNILPIYEVGESERLPFFTMKFATGGSLQQAAPALSADPGECVELLAKVTRAVAHAHAVGILHRDLKPGNILLDARGEPLVTDFGLAKWMDASSHLTRSLAVYGTPGFIAPEQAEGRSAALTAAADIYSLGAILFDLLAGRPPFLGEHALAVIRQAAEKPAPKLRSLRRSADRDLETICAKCLERDPRARYGSATELADDLERWLDGCPIVARPVSPPVAVWRWSKRNPMLATAAVTCLFVGGIAVTRQLDSWRVKNEMAAQFAAQHSVEITPLIDLDEVAPSEAWTKTVADALVADLKTFGPATVRISNERSSDKQGARDKAAASPARTLLSGTVRTINGTSRVSLHLLDANSREPLLHRVVDIDPNAPSGFGRNAFADVYGILATRDLKTRVRRPTDPGLTDQLTRNFIDAGLDLAYRRGATDFNRSIRCLEQAIALQPESSAAHAALAKVMSLKAAYGSNREPLAPAIELARRAVALDPTSGPAHLALAAALYHQGDVNEATSAALTSLEHSSSAKDGVGLLTNIHKATGRPDLAIAWLALAWDPAREAKLHGVGPADCLSLLTEDHLAEPLYHRYFAMHPEQPDGWMGICRLRLLNGRTEEARAIYRERAKDYGDFVYAAQTAAQVEFFGRNFAEADRMYGELYRKDPDGGGSFHAGLSYASVLGRLKLQSDPAAAKELLEKARRREMETLESAENNPAALYRVAAIDASLGAVESAIGHLEAAATVGWIDFRSATYDPRFDSLREDPRFEQQLARMQARVAELKRDRPIPHVFAGK